jgi:hypothetical protein
MIIEYLTRLRMEAVNDSSWILMQPFVVTIDNDLITVPENFTTDLASVPRVPVAYMLVGGRGTYAAVIHDYLYATGQYSRAFADEVFLNALKKDGVGFFLRRMMYVGVRVGGVGRFNKQVTLEQGGV